MVGEARRIDITRIPELLELVEEMQRAGQRGYLCRDDQPVAILTPVGERPAKERPARLRRRRRPVLDDDPLFDIVGMSNEPGPTDVSSNKHKYLAQALYPAATPSEPE